jgi:hypothetical protein
MIVLSRSKNAAVWACGAAFAVICGEVCWCAAGSKTVTDLAYVDAQTGLQACTQIADRDGVARGTGGVFAARRVFSLEQLLR